WLAAHDSQVERVLDLACGTGVAALVFAEAGKRVVGIDRSAAMLMIARGKARDAGHDLSFVLGDIRKLTTKDERRRTNDLERRSALLNPRRSRRSRRSGRRISKRSSCASCPSWIAQSAFATSALAGLLSPCLRVSVSPASFDLATCFYDSLNYVTN